MGQEIDQRVAFGVGGRGRVGLSGAVTDANPRQWRVGGSAGCG